MKIIFVGEGWNADEAQARTPFVGSVGYVLDQMLELAGINKQDCYFTNVFNLEVGGGASCFGSYKDSKNNFPHFTKGKYLKDQYVGELERLYKEISEIKPNIVVALGGLAAWALKGSPTIAKVRGTVFAGPNDIKCLATYHPQAVGS